MKHGTTFGAKPWAPNALQFEKLEAFSAALMSTPYSDVLLRVLVKLWVRTPNNSNVRFMNLLDRMYLQATAMEDAKTGLLSSDPRRRHAMPKKKVCQWRDSVDLLKPLMLYFL